MDIFLQQIINGLVLGSMYALVALGYTMVYGIINLINFAHGEVLMVGALSAGPWSPRAGRQRLPGWLLLLISLLCADRRLRGAQLRDREARLPAAAQRAAPGAADHRHGHEPAAADAGHDHLEAQPQALSARCCHRAHRPGRPGDQRHAVPDPGLTAVVLASLMYLVNRTKLGRAMRATAENPRVAALMGVKPDMVISPPSSSAPRWPRWPA
jgi:branched-chain amino acid transport system permease protein